MFNARRLVRPLPIAAALCASLVALSSPALAASPDPAATLQLSVDQTSVGENFYRDTTGLSIEKVNLAFPSAIGSPTLAQYLRTLSPHGVLRIGGNGAEQTFWTSTGEPTPSWAGWVVTPEDLTALAHLAHLTNWKIVYGVNLRHYDPSRAADEVSHAVQALGDSLLGVEIGNEPNLYYTDPNAFLADFDTYVQAIKASNPGVDIWGDTQAGGGVAGPPTRLDNFMTTFVNHETSLTQPNIDVLNSHRYSIAGCNLTIPLMLSDARRRDAIGYATPLVAAARALGVPAYLSETNSASGGGCAGVSDTYAAGLWSLDYTLTEAQQGERGVYFHTSFGPCGGTAAYFARYTSMCASTEDDWLAGREHARAPYYGLLALGMVGTGQFLGVTNPDTADVRAYAIRDGQHLSLVLINVTDPAAAGPVTVSTDLGGTYHSGGSTTLKTDAPDGLAATTGVSLGGGVVNAEGVLTGAHLTPVGVHGSTLQVTLAPGTAQIITLN